MSDSYEPALVKARKLAAMADPTNGGARGEVENARRALKALCDRHGITPEKLAQSSRRRRQLPVVVKSAMWKPKQDMELTRLAVGLLRFVLDESGKGVRDFEVWDGECLQPVPIKERNGKGTKGVRKIYVVSAMLTDLEFENWRECFDHYALQFVAAAKELNAALARARRARKALANAFANKYHLFPSDAEEGGSLSTEQLQALLEAMGQVKGDKWQRTAKLEQQGFLLV